MVGKILQDTYQVVRLIGEGGVGQVYLAKHVRLPKRAAIKVLRPEYAGGAEALTRFRREAEITSGIGHHHIVEVLDFNSTPDGLPYIAMEFLVGQNLDERLERERLPLAAAVSIFLQTADAVAAAHARGVVHRDLKPPNIFICPRSDAPYFVKVLDFGISKVQGAGHNLTIESTALGTPLYMAPEQALGRNAELDSRVDQFALASIFYEMLTGQPAFLADSLTSIMYRVVHDQPDPIAGLALEVPDELAAIVMRGLAKQPDDRFASVTEMQQAVRAAMAAAPAPAPGPSPTRPRAVTAAPSSTLSVATGQMTPPRASSTSDSLLTSAAPRRRLWLAAAGLLFAALIVVWATRLSSHPSERQPPAPVVIITPLENRADAALPRPLVVQADAGLADASTAPPPTRPRSPRKPSSHGAVPSPLGGGLD